MRFIYLIILLLSVFITLQNKQNINYWGNAPIYGTRIYTLYFSTDTAYAISRDDILFISDDAGKTWHPQKVLTKIRIKPEEFVWSGEIYCSVMKTNDGGKNWAPYTSEMQDHFCRVYFKDPNIGYKTAEEFLSNVSGEIIKSINNKETEILINHPKQCTEYYSNKDEGWALGWCLKDFMLSGNLSEIK